MRLITSVPPILSRFGLFGDETGLPYLRKCVESWRGSGFSPVSLNRPEEADTVRALNLLDVEEASDPYAAVPNKFGPSLGAIFDFAESEEIVAIANADLFMMPQGSGSELRQAANEGFVLGQRLEVSSLNGTIAGLCPAGFDFCAFRPASLSAGLVNTHLRRLQLGTPWWDYILPAAASFQVPLHRIRAPFLLHHRHSEAWTRDLRDRLFPDAVAALRALCDPVSTAAQADLKRAISDPNLRPTALANILQEWLARDAHDVIDVGCDLNSEPFRTMVQRTVSLPARPPVPGLIAHLHDRPPFSQAFRAISTDLSTWFASSAKLLERSIRGRVQGTSTGHLQGDLSYLAEKIDSRGRIVGVGPAQDVRVRSLLLARPVANGFVVQTPSDIPPEPIELLLSGTRFAATDGMLRQAFDLARYVYLAYEAEDCISPDAWAPLGFEIEKRLDAGVLLRSKSR